MAETFQKRFSQNFTFTHFFGRVDQFYRYANQWSVCSISGHRLALEKFDNIRVTRFIRDPRDLVISSYFYHKRSAENWCSFVDPRPQDLIRVNGAVPSAIPQGESLGRRQAGTVRDQLDNHQSFQCSSIIQQPGNFRSFHIV